MSGINITEQRNLLIGLIKKINSKLNTDQILSEIMDATKKIMLSEASSLFILSDNKRQLILTIPTGPATAELSGKKIPADHGVSGWCVQNKSPIIVNNVNEDQRFTGDLITNSSFKTINLICVPLITNDGECIGALQAINQINKQEFDEDDLDIFQSLASHAAIAIENAKLQDERIQREVLEKELDLAREIQSGFWPDEIPNIRNYAVAGLSRPAKSVGGDYYDFIEHQDPSKWGFTVADVSGKGVAASLLMATMRASLRSHIVDLCPVEECIDKVNKMICNDSPPDKFITAFYGELDASSHTFRYVNAGHDNPYLLRAESGELEVLTTGGIMLGIFYPNPYEIDSVSFQIHDKLIIFSDGIPEARNATGDFYESERLKQWLIDNKDRSATEMLHGLIEDVDSFCAGHPQSDDITCVVLERLS